MQHVWQGRGRLGVQALQAALAEVRQLSPSGPPATDSTPAKRLARLVYETGAHAMLAARPPRPATTVHACPPRSPLCTRSRTGRPRLLRTIPAQLFWV